MHGVSMKVQYSNILFIPQCLESRISDFWGLESICQNVKYQCDNPYNIFHEFEVKSLVAKDRMMTSIKLIEF